MGTVIQSNDLNSAGEIFAVDGLARTNREAIVAALVNDFAATAVERDKAGGTAKRERDLIRQSGLLALIIPTELGGLGSDLNEALAITRRIARVDSSLAHLFAFHHYMLATLQLFGQRAHWASLFQSTAQDCWFWGNALNPLDKTTSLTPSASGDAHLLNGTKSFCSGATDSDMLIVSAIRAADDAFIVGAIPTKRAGITIHDDWDNIGQRQTDSGRVSFQNVVIAENEILRPGPHSSVFSTLRACLGQLILANLYVGIGEGALQQARDHAREYGRPWPLAKLETIEQDPYILRHFGECWVELAGAAALTDLAQSRFQNAFNTGHKLTAPTRGEVAVSIATAKVASARAALNVSTRIFDILGARATAAKFGLDRFWRNARTHTLHDPVDYKLRELGAWSLTGTPPEPSFYS